MAKAKNISRTKFPSVELILNSEEAEALNDLLTHRITGSGFGSLFSSMREELARIANESNCRPRRVWGAKTSESHYRDNVLDYSNAYFE